jgi:hypothetical protein
VLRSQLRDTKSIVHRTPTFQALGFAFSVLADDRRLIEHIAELFADLPAALSDGHRYSFRPVPAPVGQQHCELQLDGLALFSGLPPQPLVSNLVRDVNRRAVEGSDGLVLHAGGVERHGVGLVLPADRDAGKTTLVAGLVQAGFAYLSDEAVPIDAETLTMQPYVKPLSLDPGSFPLFPELEPRADGFGDEADVYQWQVPARALRRESIGRPCRISVIAFPRYAKGAKTQLIPVGRAEALMELAKNTFRFRDRARASLDTLSGVIRGTACYRLTIGDLQTAVNLLSRLLDDPNPEREAS